MEIANMKFSTWDDGWGIHFSDKDHLSFCINGCGSRRGVFGTLENNHVECAVKGDHDNFLYFRPDQIGAFISAATIYFQANGTLDGFHSSYQRGNQ